MADRISYISQLKPIESYNEFGNKLASNATPKLGEDDVLAYFGDKIDAMSSFSLGLYQWCIVDFADQKLFEIGGMMEEMTGKPYEYWKNLPAENYVSELAYPDHIPYWMAYIDYIYKYILQNPHKSFRPHIYIKMKNKEGMYRNVVMQIVDWKFEEDGGVRYCLNQITDISHLVIDYVPQMTILILEGKERKVLKSQPIPYNPISISLPSFSTRELEVLRLMASGFTSKLIADKLSIAKNTVENHRQRLLRKTNCYTSSEVVAYALNYGLL